jgi:hypothetical protein
MRAIDVAFTGCREALFPLRSNCWEPLPRFPVASNRGVHVDKQRRWRMPLGRYFAFVGSALLALLFVADWYMPKLAAEPARSDVDRSIIRIHSGHKWPEAVVIDTRLPTIVPPPIAAAAAMAQEKTPGNAFALATPDTVAGHAVPAVRPASVSIAPKRVAERRRTRSYPASPRVARYDMIGPRDAWFGGW